jgi:hypothetical protein
MPPRKSGSVKVRRRAVYIRKGESPWNVYIKIPSTARTVLAIDIGPRNLGLMDVRIRPHKQLRRFLWADLFRAPGTTYGKASEVRGAMTQFVRERPDWFSADLWIIEEQPALQADNVAVQNALETCAEFLGKTVLLINPNTLKTVLLPGAFGTTGHDPNKMQSMKMLRPLVRAEEVVAVKAAVMRQEAYARHYRKGQEKAGVQYRRYKSGRLGAETHRWDDMADVLVFMTLALSVLDDTDYFATPFAYDLPPQAGFCDDDAGVTPDGKFFVRWPNGSVQVVDDYLGDYFEKHLEDEGDDGAVSLAAPARRVKKARLNPRGIEPRKRALKSAPKPAVVDLTAEDDGGCVTWDPWK